MTTVGIPSTSAAVPILLGSANAAARSSAGFREVVGFVLFLLVNATLFIRPGEIVGLWLGVFRWQGRT